ILHSAPQRPRRTSYGLGVLALFATTLQSGALGALITLSRRAWYPVQTVGAMALEDQQVAGLVMWVGGGLLQLVAVSVVVFLWLRENERRGHSVHALSSSRVLTTV